jgi:hypothetical protein
MKLLTRLGNFYKRATEGVQNLASLTVDQQYEALDKRLLGEQEAEEEKLRNVYPTGWFKVQVSTGEELRHWCPDCKTLSQGKVAKHCGSRKQETRPEGWRQAFLPKTHPVIFA